MAQHFRRSPPLFVATFVLALGWYAAGTGANPATEPPGQTAQKKEGGEQLRGAWVLVECDHGGRTIGYHPMVKVPPGYALLMFAHTTLNPDKGADKFTMRWRFDKESLTVELLPEQKKADEPARQKLADFRWQADAGKEPATIDLTWMPPGFDGIAGDKKGQVAQALYALKGDKLEVVLSQTGEDRPKACKADKSSYRLVFKRVRN